MQQRNLELKKDLTFKPELTTFRKKNKRVSVGEGLDKLYMREEYPHREANCSDNEDLPMVSLA